MADSKKKSIRVSKIYQTLYDFYGTQHWWPADSKLEIIIGAILTQNTAWQNVEKAVSNLKKRRLIDLKKLSKLPVSQIGKLIRASGFYKIKAKRLKAVIDFLLKEYNGNLSQMKKKRWQELRAELLQVYGIGQETADSILLYALDKPVFVIDAYTRRIFSRHHLIDRNSKYSEIQRFFMSNLPKSKNIYQEYHALLVKLAKDFCRTKPKCEQCPINKI